MSVKKAVEREFINSRSWYQTIHFEEGLSSTGCEWCGDPAWENIQRFLPENLFDMRVADLGCNAGLFCVRAAMRGAKEVVGVDWPGWRPTWDFAEQRKFVRSYFEDKCSRKLPITYLTMKMEDFLHKEERKYDYIMAIASIYYTQDPEAVVKNIARLGENVILRLREESIIERFLALFRKNGMEVGDHLREKWWEKLGRDTDDFHLFLIQHRSKPVNRHFYRISDGHEELTQHAIPVNIFYLMNLVGSECAVHNYTPKIPARHITQIKLKDLMRVKSHAPQVDDDMRSHYPWDGLVESIRQHGVLVPIIAEEYGDKYLTLEGRHRVTAAAMIEPRDDSMTIPALVVRRVDV